MQKFVTPKAERDLDAIMHYLQIKWGRSVANKFLKKTKNTFKVLQHYPQLGELEHGDIRGIQLTTQVRILYRLRPHKIVIIAFFDNRQNPAKKPI